MFCDETKHYELYDIIQQYRWHDFIHYLFEDLDGRSDGTKKTDDAERAVVDVRDLANAIVLLYEKQESEGRYICSSYSLMTREFVAKVQNIFPDYDYPKK